MNNMKALAHKLVAPFINDEQGPFETVGRWHRQLGRISLAMDQADDESYIHGGEYLYGEL